MKLLAVISVCTGMVFGVALGSGVSAAPAIQEPADTYAFEDPTGEDPACSNQVLDVFERGNKTHLKLLNHGIMVSVDPRLTGPVVVDVEIAINNVSGHIGGHGSFVLEPTGYSGTWEADFNISAPRGKSIDVDGLMIVKDSQMNARGTGEFAGQWFFFEHGLAVGDPPYDIPVEDPDGPGGCEFLGEVWSGRILNPNAH